MGDIIFLLIMFVLGIIIVISACLMFISRRMSEPNKNLKGKIETLENEVERLKNNKKK